VAEKILAGFALVAAFISIAWTGHLYDKIFGGLISLYATAKGFALSYYNNELFSEVWKRFTDEFVSRLQSAGENIESDPQTVLVAFVLTFVCYKLAAWILYMARKGMKGGRTPRIKKSVKEDAKGTAYEELYKPPRIEPSTADYLERMKATSHRTDDDEDPDWC